MGKSNEYTEDLRLIKSLLIVTSLQKRNDLKAYKALQEFNEEISWDGNDRLMIDREVWNYAINVKGYDPKFIFAHPQILKAKPVTSLYFRGMCGLSMKAAKDHFGAVENLEKGNPKARLGPKKALKMAQVYNTYICSIIKNSTDWTLENGHRTIIATMGITLDGVMRNKVGDIAEQRIRTLVLEWVIERGLLVEPHLSKEDILEDIPSEYRLQNNIIMRFGSEPDVAFWQESEKGRELLAVVEIKGGIDPAGALERYGAATKSFQHGLAESPRCKNIFLSAVYTPELERRIKIDRLVEKYFDIVKMLEDSTIRDDFFQELFHHILRLV